MQIVKFDVSGAKVFMPYKINAEQTAVLRNQELPGELSRVAEELVMNGWRFYVVNQFRGRCYHGGKVITIPIHAIRKGPGYLLYYFAHEVAHTQAVGDNHGDKFMQALIRLCPAHLLHYELGYKPQAAKRNGIVYHGPQL